MDFVHLIVPLAGLTVNVAVQILSIRNAPSAGLLKTVFLGMLAGLACVVFAEYYVFLRGWGGGTAAFLAMTLANVFIYIALSYSYFHFINLGETARRIRILREIYDSKDRSLTMDEILGRYNAAEVLEKRFARLVSKRQVVERDGRLYIGNKTMLFMSRIIVAMKRVLLGKSSEFEKA